MEDPIICIYEPDEKTRSLLASTLKDETGQEIVEIESADKLPSYANKFGVLIIQKNTLQQAFFQSFLAHCSDLKVISIGGVAKEKVAVVPTPLEIKQLMEAIKDKLGDSVEFFSSSAKAGLSAIPLKHFYFFQCSPCDVYIRISKKDGEDKYVKRLFADHEFGSGEIRNFEEKGVVDFFVKVSDRDNFLNYLIKTFTPEKIISETLKHGYLDIGIEVHELVSEVVTQTTITDAVVDLANQGIKSMAEKIQSNKNLLSLLKDLLRNKGSYNYKHSFLISIFSYEIMGMMDWGKTSRLEEQHEIMTFVSFYHDILLKKDELVQIRCKKDFFRAELNETQKELVKHHAKLVADMLGETKGTPAQASHILRHHHGMTNGIGFASSYNASIPPLAILFIVVEFFVHAILDPKAGQEGLEHIFSLCDEEFPLPTYRRVVDHLKSIFQFDK